MIDSRIVTIHAQKHPQTDSVKGHRVTLATEERVCNSCEETGKLGAILNEESYFTIPRNFTYVLANKQVSFF